MSSSQSIEQKMRETLDKILDYIRIELEKGEEKNLRLVSEILNEVRQLYKLLERDKDHLEPFDKDKLYDDVIACLIESEVPDSYISRFGEAWRERCDD